MGKAMCKARPNDPNCKRFTKKKEEEKKEEENAEKTEKEEEEAKAPTEAPATEAAAEATEAPGPIETTGEPPKLLAQGFKGKKVRHVDGKTMTKDWRDEYEHATTA